MQQGDPSLLMVLVTSKSPFVIIDRKNVCVGIMIIIIDVMYSTITKCQLLY